MQALGRAYSGPAYGITTRTAAGASTMAALTRASAPARRARRRTAAIKPGLRMRAVPTGAWTQVLPLGLNHDPKAADPIYRLRWRRAPRCNRRRPHLPRKPRRSRNPNQLCNRCRLCNPHPPIDDSIAAAKCAALRNPRSPQLSWDPYQSCKRHLLRKPHRQRAATGMQRGSIPARASMRREHPSRAWTSAMSKVRPARNPPPRPRHGMNRLPAIKRRRRARRAPTSVLPRPKRDGNPARRPMHAGRWIHSTIR